MKDVLVKIRKIYAKHDLFISARVCMALVVEYVIRFANVGDMQDVLIVHIDQRPEDQYNATKETVEYLNSLTITILGALLIRNADAWLKFDIDGKVWYIDFRMDEMIRSDFIDGPYSLREGS